MSQFAVGKNVEPAASSRGPAVGLKRLVVFIIDEFVVLVVVLVIGDIIVSDWFDLKRDD